MKSSIPILCTAAVLPFLTITVRAQDNPAPAAAAVDAPEQMEMQKWIATTDAQWQATFNREVTDVHAAELKKLAAQYGALIEAGINKASGAGDLDGAVALRKEQKRFAETNIFPEQDEEGDAASVKQIRAVTRAQLAKLKAENAARTRALHAKYDQVLAQAQTQLTQRKRLDDALLVKAKRDEVKSAWLAGIPEAPAVAVAEQRKPKPAARPNPPVVKAEPDERNFFKNPNFENETDGWELDTFGKDATMTVDKKETHNGKPSLRIDNIHGGLTFVRQHVEAKPNTHYQMSGFIMTKSVEPMKKGSREGACLLVGFSGEVRVWPGTSKAAAGKSVPIQKTKQWTRVVVDFTTGPKTRLPVGAALGYYNDDVKGTAWFSELSLVEVGSNAKK